MRAFACTRCERLVPFESFQCLHCGAELAFDFSVREIVAVERQADGALRHLGEIAAPRWKCANNPLIGCNWLAESEGSLCPSCRLTRRRPADGDVESIERLNRAEDAKRRLLFELGELGLPIVSQLDQPDGMLFDLLSSSGEKVITGHADGLVTLDLAEGDAAHREAMRERLSEPYRTLLGHMRHEIGHYYWTVLVQGQSDLEQQARDLMGDERADYQEALDRHYEQGAPADWHLQHVSAYATMHPAEDWAETFAHYLHLWDTLQTAAEYGVQVHGPSGVSDPDGVASSGPISTPVVGRLRDSLSQWLPLTYACNELNRSMGMPDFYPFVLTAPVVDKLAFVDLVVQRASSAAATSRPVPMV